jgi:all-trans-retinol 13,14-reductase
VERLIPGVSQHVVSSSLGTPLTNAFYVEASEGNVYGSEKTRHQVGPFSFKPKSELRDLYLCGSSVMSHGVLGATLSGLAAAGAVLKARPSELLRAKGQKLETFSADDPSGWPDWLTQTVRDRADRGRPLARAR